MYVYISVSKSQQVDMNDLNLSRRPPDDVYVQCGLTDVHIYLIGIHIRHLSQWNQHSMLQESSVETRVENCYEHSYKVELTRGLLMYLYLFWNGKDMFLHERIIGN